MTDRVIPTLLITLFPHRLPAGPIDFDGLLSGVKIVGQIHREDPEFAAAEKAIETHQVKWTMAGPTAPTLEMSVQGVKELTARRWK